MTIPCEVCPLRGVAGQKITNYMKAVMTFGGMGLSAYINGRDGSVSCNGMNRIKTRECNVPYDAPAPQLIINDFRISELPEC